MTLEEQKALMLVADGVIAELKSGVYLQRLSRANFIAAARKETTEPPKRHVVAFDVDDTWTLAPDLFLALTSLFIRAEWTVIIVTGAEQPEDKLTRLCIPDFIPIIVARHELKKDAALKAGYNVNVWIDDRPGTIEAQRILSDVPDAQL